MNMKFFANITQEDGIVIMVIMKPALTIEIFEKMFPMSDVYFILTNMNNKIENFT